MTKYFLFIAATFLISIAPMHTVFATPSADAKPTPPAPVITNLLDKVITQPSQKNLRRSLSGGVEMVVSCVKFENNTCTCPGGCMSYNNDPTNPKCLLKKCWGWDTDKTECIETGPSFMSAIVLQGIPFTGIFGAGFGNMGRWDLFGIAMAICFGPLIVLMFQACCLIFLSSKDDDNENECAKCLSNCIGCIWSVAIIGWWIYGIVVIADKRINAPTGCPLH